MGDDVQNIIIQSAMRREQERLTRRISQPFRGSHFPTARIVKLPCALPGSCRGTINRININRIRNATALREKGIVGKGKKEKRKGRKKERGRNK